MKKLELEKTIIIDSKGKKETTKKPVVKKENKKAINKKVVKELITDKHNLDFESIKTFIVIDSDKIEYDKIKTYNDLFKYEIARQEKGKRFTYDLSDKMQLTKEKRYIHIKTSYIITLKEYKALNDKEKAEYVEYSNPYSSMTNFRADFLKGRTFTNDKKKNMIVLAIYNDKIKVAK